MTLSVSFDFPTYYQKHGFEPHEIGGFRPFYKTEQRNFPLMADSWTERVSPAFAIAGE